MHAEVIDTLQKWYFIHPKLCVDVAGQGIFCMNMRLRMYSIVIQISAVLQAIHVLHD